MLPDKGRNNGKFITHRFMTLQEVKLFFDKIEPGETHYKVLCGLMFFRGLRLLEACATNLSDFSNEFTELSWRCSKTDKVYLNRPLVDPLSEMIKDYLKLNWHTFRNGYIFPNRAGRWPHIHPYTVYNWFLKHAERLGMGDTFESHSQFLDERKRKTKTMHRVTPHCGKRFFGTYIYMISKDPRFTQAVLNHEKVDTTMRHYVNPAELMVREKEVLTKMAQPLFNPVTLHKYQTTLV